MSATESQPLPLPHAPKRPFIFLKTPIQASVGTGAFLIAETTMVGSVGSVVAPSFTTFKVGQTSTRPNSLNFICVTLQTNTLFNSDTSGQVTVAVGRKSWQ